MPQPAIAYDSKQGQCVCLLAAALESLGGSNRKQSVLNEINSRRWWAIEPEDKTPYPANKGRSNEPRWKTLIVWARQHSVWRDWVLDHERDAWALSRLGREMWPLAKQKFASDEWKVSKCYLWSPLFKCHLNERYTPSEKDTKRPQQIYLDISNFDYDSFREELRELGLL